MPLRRWDIAWFTEGRSIEPQRITREMIDGAYRLKPFDPDHLPEEILLIEAFITGFPELPQVACFDTAFHHDLPRVAQVVADSAPLRSKGRSAVRISRVVVCVPHGGADALGRTGGGTRPGHPCPPRQWRESGGGLDGKSWTRV